MQSQHDKFALEQKSYRGDASQGLRYYALGRTTPYFGNSQKTLDIL